MAGFLPRLFTALLPRMTPFREMGVSGTPVYAGYVLSPERSSKLIGQEKYRTYANILANTSIVAAGVRYFLNIISKPSWSAEPADKSDEARKYAEFVEDVFDDLHTPWSRIVRRLGTYRFHGFAIQEWTAKRREDGKIGFHDIEARPQWTIWRWEVDERGSVTGAWQRDPLTGRELGLPRGKIMDLVDDTLTDSPEGMGLLRHCYEPATRLDEYLKQEAFGFMRDLRGIPMGRAPMTELQSAVAAGNIKQSDMDAGIEKVRQFCAMEAKTRDTAIVLESQTYQNLTDSGITPSSEKKWDVELITGEAPGLTDMGQAIVRLNTEIARILGIEHLMLGADSAGSYAMAKEKAQDMYMLANSVEEDICKQVEHDLIWPLWSLNGFPDKMMPKLKHEDVQPRDVEQVARVMRDLATAGAPMQPDDEAQNFIRDLLGAPQVDLAKLKQQLMEQQEMQDQLAPVSTGGGGYGSQPRIPTTDQEAAAAEASTAKRLQNLSEARALVQQAIRKSSNGNLSALEEASDKLDELLKAEGYEQQEAEDQADDHLQSALDGMSRLSREVQSTSTEINRNKLMPAFRLVMDYLNNLPLADSIVEGKAAVLAGDKLGNIIDKFSSGDSNDKKAVRASYREFKQAFDKLIEHRGIEKAVPYAQAKPYMVEDEAIVAERGRPGASEAMQPTADTFTPRRRLRPGGPDARGMKGEDVSTETVGGQPDFDSVAPGNNLAWGDLGTPGSRMKINRRGYAARTNGGTGMDRGGGK